MHTFIDKAFSVCEIKRIYITEMSSKGNPYSLAKSVGHGGVEMIMRYTRDKPELVLMAVEENDGLYMTNAMNS